MMTLDTNDWCEAGLHHDLAALAWMERTCGTTNVTRLDFPGDGTVIAHHIPKAFVDGAGDPRRSGLLYRWCFCTRHIDTPWTCWDEHAFGLLSTHRRHPLAADIPSQVKAVMRVLV